jgi:hypothetical protein
LVGDGYVLNEKIRKVKVMLSNSNKLLTDCHWNNYLNFRIVNCINEYTKKLRIKYIGIIKNTNQIDILKIRKQIIIIFM